MSYPDKKKPKVQTNSTGAYNEHDLLKKAEVDDSEGILKYGVDLDQSMEK